MLHSCDCVSCVALQLMLPRTKAGGSCKRLCEEAPRGCWQQGAMAAQTWRSRAALITGRHGRLCSALGKTSPSLNCFPRECIRCAMAKPAVCVIFHALSISLHSFCSLSPHFTFFQVATGMRFLLGTNADILSVNHSTAASGELLSAVH